jgi:5'-3' exoribonuclease 2
MNQQRARRFRSARDAKEADEKKAEFQTLLRKQQSQNGQQDESSTTEDVVKKTWDTNVITPGTPFMFLLARSVRYWVQWKLNTDPAWEQLKVVISDASVPGEGEHKIMQFIRSQRSDPEYDPNTTHVMYGLDADLIMLGLATHEPHFRVLREDVFLRDAKAKTCKLCGRQGHYAENCRGNTKEKAGDFDEKGTTEEVKPFIWLHTSILREYLGAEMFVPGQPFRFDLERALDDWVFMCFFVGNDFLPHLPSLDIHEDGIDKLIAIWRDNIPVMGGYLTCDGTVDLARAQCILQGLAKQEDAIFRRRKEVDDKRERNQKRRKQEDEAREQARESRDAKRRRSSADYNIGASNGLTKGNSDNRAPMSVPMNLVPASSIDVQVDYNMIVNRGAVDRANAANKSAAAAMKAQMLAKAGRGVETPVKDGSTIGDSEAVQTPPSALGKRKADLIEESSDIETPGRSTPVESNAPKYNTADPDDAPPDTVRLWEEGYADRYFEQKFHVAPNDIEFRHKVARSYVEGLCWVLAYYLQGCPSWTWYYPYHYAPFAADFVDLDKLTIKFEKGTPFKPYEQLMGVFPASSKHAIPESFHSLMTDEDSDIIDFYPEDFDLDLNGKKQSWKAVVLLPFIDEKRLLDAMGTRYPLLSAEEHARNTLGKDALLLSDKHALYDFLAVPFYSKKSKDSQPVIKLATRIGNLAGKVERNDYFLPHMDLFAPEEDIKLEPEVNDDRSMRCVTLTLLSNPNATPSLTSILAAAFISLCQLQHIYTNQCYSAALRSRLSSLTTPTWRY